MCYIHDIIDIANRYGFPIKENESMSKYTTFKIGGNARVIIKATSNEGLIDILTKCKEYNVPVFVLGKGSNLLVSDKGIDAVVIRLDGVFNEIKQIDSETIYCGAGVSLAKLCSFACECGLSGLEFAWGIPGSVGGAVYMNAGAYGGEIKDVISPTPVTSQLDGVRVKLNYDKYADTIANVVIDGKKLSELAEIKKSFMYDYILVKINSESSLVEDSN